MRVSKCDERKNVTDIRALMEEGAGAFVAALNFVR